MRPKAILNWTDGQASSGLTGGYRFLQSMSDGVLKVSRSVAMDDGQTNAQAPSIQARNEAAPGTTKVTNVLWD